MIKGLAITPPIVGRISIGHVVEKNGQRLPEKDDQFTVTTQIQTQEGWIRHPLDEQLRNETDNGKLRTIPVRMLFNDPELNFRAEYSLFDRSTGRPQCVGDGETCRRFTAEGVQTLPCPGPDACELAQGGACKPYGRLHVRIGDDDELGTFIFRTTGYNSIRTLAARLRYYQAVSGGLLACMSLELRLRGKSTTQSYRSAIYYVDLTVREGLPLEEAIARARETYQRREAQGYDQKALDAAAGQAVANAAFEIDSEEGSEIVEEFFPELPSSANGSGPTKGQAGQSGTVGRTLTEKLDQRTAPSTSS
jgi:hypothetical protein